MNLGCSFVHVLAYLKHVHIFFSQIVDGECEGIGELKDIFVTLSLSLYFRVFHIIFIKNKYKLKKG